MKSNIDIVRELIRVVWNGGQLDRIEDFYTATFRAHYPPIGPSWGEGREGLKNIVSLVRTGFPDYTENIEDIHAVEDRVFVRMRNTGTNRGPLPTVPTPTNKAFEVADFVHIRMENGKIAEQWGLTDNLSMFLQLGLLELPQVH
jgi:predicted SnoaL-like aldol condensation-catalyzing enzyme